jgi:hypothetical protein
VKLTQTIPMDFMQCGDVRMVCGKSVDAIPQGSVLLLVKISVTKFELRVVSDSGDESDPLLLASWLAPEQVDDIERAVAKSVAMDKPKRPRRPRKSKANT